MPCTIYVPCYHFHVHLPSFEKPAIIYTPLYYIIKLYACHIDFIYVPVFKLPAFHLPLPYVHHAMTSFFLPCHFRDHVNVEICLPYALYMPSMCMPAVLLCHIPISMFFFKKNRATSLVNSFPTITIPHIQSIIGHIICLLFPYGGVLLKVTYIHVYVYMVR